MTWEQYSPSREADGESMDALVQQRNATVPYELKAGMGISPDAKGNTTGTIAAVTGDGSDQLQLETGSNNDRLTGTETSFGQNHISTDLVEDRFTIGAGGDSFNCDDIHLGHDAIGYEMQAGLDLGSDNRFVIEPIYLFKGLDAGGMNYAKAVGLDSSSLQLINKISGSANPGGDDI